MALRKEIKNIAFGLYGSFISRNNDVGGYWAIGKFCLFAQQQKARVVCIDLLAHSITPTTVEFSKLLAHYNSFLKKHLSARAIPHSWVSTVIIELDFQPELLNGKHIPSVTWGNLFNLTVTIKDDLDKQYLVSGYSYCGPHNPRKEQRRADSERF